MEGSKPGDSVLWPDRPRGLRTLKKVVGGWVGGLEEPSEPDGCGLEGGLQGAEGSQSPSESGFLLGRRGICNERVVLMWWGSQAFLPEARKPGGVRLGAPSVELRGQGMFG